MDSKTLGFIGILRRAGKITIGCDPVCDSVARGKTKLVLMAEDISENTKKAVLRRTEEYSPHIYIIKCSKSELSNAVGRQAAVISVDDEKAALSAEKKLADEKEECHYGNKG